MLDSFPGIRVVVKERRPKYPPKCPKCRRIISSCPGCGEPMTGTQEKGVDTAIVTDMISLAWENAWEVAILVASDHDFVPAVEFLANKGRRVISAYFPPKGANLARACWASIDLRPHTKSLTR